MVKGVARSGGPSSQPSPPQQLPTMQAGQNPHDPLTLLNSHLGFGAMAGINPFAELGVNPNDPNMASPYHCLGDIVALTRIYAFPVSSKR
jgi:ubiquilin